MSDVVISMRSRYASDEVGLYDCPRSNAAAEMRIFILSSVFTPVCVSTGAATVEAARISAGPARELAVKAAVANHMFRNIERRAIHRRGRT